MKPHQRTTLAVALMVSMVVLSAVLSLHGALLTSIIDHYHLSASSQGAASAASSAGCVVALVASFALIGRLNKLTLLRLAMCLTAVGLVLLKLAPMFGMFVAIWLMVGIGAGFADMLLSSCMADLYTGRMATRMMCLLHTLFGISSTVSPIIYAQLIGHGLMWNSVYLCVAGAELVALIFLTIAIRLARGDRTEAIADERRLSIRDMGGILKKGAMPGLLLAMGCHGIFLGGLNTWINRYVGVTLMSDMGTLALSFMFFGVMASRLLVSFTPISTVRYVRLSGLIGGAVLLIAMPFQNGTIMCVALCVSGLAFGGLIPCLLDLGCREVPESSMLATTAMTLSLYLMQIVASPVIGALESAISLHVGIAMCGAFMMLTSVCCLFARF